jgi:hypothetical protein
MPPRVGSLRKRCRRHWTRFVCADFCRGMDESALTTCHRVPARREPDVTGSARQPPTSFHRRAAPWLGNRGKVARTKAAGEGRYRLTPWHRKLIGTNTTAALTAGGVGRQQGRNWKPWLSVWPWRTGIGDTFESAALSPISATNWPAAQSLVFGSATP